MSGIKRYLEQLDEYTSQERLGDTAVSPEQAAERLIRIRELEESIFQINTAFHALIADAIAKGEGNALLTHPNPTVRSTAQSYLITKPYMRPSDV